VCQTQTRNDNVKKVETMPTVTELDNLLVGQKNNLINEIDEHCVELYEFENHGKLVFMRQSIERLRATLKTMELVRPMWESCNYGYKWQELTFRMENGLRAAVRACLCHYVNPRTAKVAEPELEAFINELRSL